MWPPFLRSPLALLPVLAMAALACGGGGDIAGPTTGTLEVSSSTSGSQPDGDGYSVQMDAQPAQTLGPASTLRSTEVTPGLHTLLLGGVAANCTIEGDNPRTVNVIAGQTASTVFAVSCTATTGSLRITSTTSGPSPDPDGYAASIDGTSRGTLAAAGEITLDGLVAGPHTAGLSGISGNCQVDRDNPRAVTITAGATVVAAFAVACQPTSPTAGTLRITTTTGGAGSDADGYAFGIDGSGTQPIGANVVMTVPNMSAGSHLVQLMGVADHCTLAGLNPRSVTVPTASTGEVTFTLTCQGTTGSVEIKTNTTGSSQDADGYAFAMDGGTSQAIDVTAAVTLANIPTGTHSVQLSGLAGNCAVQGANPRAISVSAGTKVEVSFAITCSTTTGSLEVRTTTTGAGPDPDGYTVTVDGGYAQAIGINSNSTVPNLSPGLHAVALADMAANCRVDGETSRPVTVVVGQQTTVSFAVFCPAITGTYQAKDLGTLDGNECCSFAYAINPAGQVVGYSRNAAGEARAFRWENDVMTDLGTLGGDFSIATGINPTGQVVGYSATTGGVTHAFLWQNGTMTDLGLPGGGYSVARGISAEGQVVGQAGSHAFLWDKGVMRDLGTLGGNSSEARAINREGQVVGYSRTAQGVYHGFLWENGVMTDLGTLGRCCSYADGVNRDGQVVGYVFDLDIEGGEDPRTYRAFVWDNGVMTDLSRFSGVPSAATGINLTGQIVGYSEMVGGGSHAALWENGVMTDLGTLVGGGLSYAVAINPAGQVVGVSQAETSPGTFVLRATLWTRK